MAESRRSLRRRVLAAVLRSARRSLRHGRTKRAVHLLQLLEKAAPNVSAIYLLLAEAAIRYGAHEVAKEALDKLAASGSRKPHIAYRIALKQLEMGELSAAERTLRIAIEQFPDSWLIWRLLAALHLNQGRTKDAIRCVNRQIASSPTERVRLSGIDRLADCLENIGDRRKASTLYWRIIETVPEYALSYFRLVLCQPSLNSTSPLERILVRTIESGSVPELESRHMHYALGHLYDRAGRVTDAISHFHRANALRARVAGGLNVEAVRAEVDARIAGFDTNRIKTFRKYGCQDDFPIFVVGMPRSGTTLVEQILSSHSKVHGLGERRDILYAVKSLPRLLRSKLRYPWCASQLTPEVVKNLSMSIASDFRKSAGASPRVVTKRPEDCFELGLISILFGNARIIDCRRHPIDTCLSCYMQNFAEVPYATNLEHLAEVYRQIGRASCRERV